MAKEEKSMEVFNAFIKKDGDQDCQLCFNINGVELQISLTDNNPQKIKEVFNKLIVKLKDGIFKFEMTDVEGDLFSQVANEYVKQLNVDLEAVYKDLEHFKLLNSQNVEAIEV